MSGYEDIRSIIAERPNEIAGRITPTPARGVREPLLEPGYAVAFFEGRRGDLGERNQIRRNLLGDCMCYVHASRLALHAGRPVSKDALQVCISKRPREPEVTTRC
jgi:hypothetical protein